MDYKLGNFALDNVEIERAKCVEIKYVKLSALYAKYAAPRFEAYFFRGVRLNWSYHPL